MSITEKISYITDDGIEHPTRDAAQRHAAARVVVLAMHRDLDAAVGRLYEKDVEAIANWILDRYDLRPDREAP